LVECGDVVVVVTWGGVVVRGRVVAVGGRVLVLRVRRDLTVSVDIGSIKEVGVCRGAKRRI
jgi:hypothetical protein